MKKSRPTQPAKTDHSELPSPEELREMAKSNKKVRITMYVDNAALQKFKKYTANNDIKYQTMVNEVIATYAREKL